MRLRWSWLWVDLGSDPKYDMWEPIRGLRIVFRPRPGVGAQSTACAWSWSFRWFVKSSREEAV